MFWGGHDLMKTYNVGVMGYGFMGRAHTYAYKALPFFYGELPINVTLQAVCSLPEGAAKKAAANNGYKLGTSDMDEFFNSGLDIVHVCSPNDTHKAVILEAIKRGIHIYCEKPVAQNYSEALEIEEALKGRSLITKVGFHSRFYPCTIRAKEILENGKLGRKLGFKIRYFTMNRLEGSASPNALASGAILDLAPHLLDMAYHLVGEFDNLIADANYLNERVPGSAEDAFYAIVKMKNGAEGIIEASKIAYGANNDYSVEIYCEKGAVKFDIENPDWLLVYDANDSPGPYGGDRGFKRIECFNRYPERVFPSPRHSPGWLGGHLHNIYDFLCGIRDNLPVSPSLNDGIYIQYAIDKLLQSVVERQWILCS
jgi:predicted dehydrogenase